MSARAAALVYLALTGVVIAFHLAMLLGAPWGHLTLGGRWPGVLPAEWRWLPALSALILLGMGFAVAGRAGLVRRRLPDWAIFVVIGYLALAVVLHILTPSPAERWLWLPQIMVMLASAVRVSRG